MKVFRAILIVTSISLILLGLGGYLFLEHIADSLCGTTEYKAVASPDQALVAKIVARDCGATTDFNTQVILESRQFWLPGSESVLSVQGQPRDTHIHLAWLSNRRLKLSASKPLNVYNSKHHWRDVEIMLP